MTTASRIRIPALLCLLLPSTQALAEPLTPITFNDNTFLGVNSGNQYMSSEALENTAFGSNAFSLNVIGSENSAIGANALWGNYSGFRNTAVGYVSLAGNFDGMDNVALGHGRCRRAVWHADRRCRKSRPRPAGTQGRQGLLV